MAFPADQVKAAVGWIKANPGYAIGGAGGAAFVGYLIYKQSQQDKAQPSGASGTTPSGSDLQATPTYDYLYGYYQGNPPPDSGTSGGTDTGTPPPTSGQQSAMVRAQTGTAWDKSHSGVPLRQQAAGSSQIITYVPWGSPVNLSGAKVTGSQNTAGGSPDWYPVSYGGQIGYISVLDLVGIGIGRVVSGWRRMMTTQHSLFFTPADEYGMVN